MTENEKLLAQKRKELELVQGCRDLLRKEQKELQKKLEEVEKQLTELQGKGGWYKDYGKIYHLDREIKSLELKVAHESKPKVVWKQKPTEWMKDYVVHKVTAKRIYVGSPGGRSSIYDKEGKSVPSGRGNFIDIEATFGGPCPDVLR